MARLRLERFSYRFAEEVLNSKLRVKQEIEDILTSTSIDISILSRPIFNKILRDAFVAKGWKDQPHVFALEDDPAAKMDFLKDRVGIEVGFGHASFMGIDLLKFQVVFVFWTRSNRCRYLHRNYEAISKGSLVAIHAQMGREPHLRKGNAISTAF